MLEYVSYHGRRVRRFVSHPETVTDGTIRCGVCGQLDDEELHDNAMCASVDRSNREFRALSRDKGNGGGEP